MPERTTTEAPAPDVERVTEATEASVPARRDVPDPRDLLPGLEPERAPPRADAGKPGRAATRQGETHGYDELDPREVVALLPSLAHDDLETLRHHEAAGERRSEVLEEIDRLLAGQSR
jgi:hypothetical protein